jgi:hypothetical protein
MDMWDETERRIGRLAWIAAWAGLVLGQLHALARHRTEDGRGDLDSPLTRFWAEPAGDLFSPLLTWGGPDTVYLTYGKAWLPIFVAFTAAAFVTYRRRRPSGFEKWAWRIALTAYVGACASVAAEYWTQWGAGSSSLLDAVFLATLPFVVLTMLGSTLLGVTLLAHRFRPRSAAILLALTFPAALLITQVTSMGNVVLPIAFAFGVVGRRASAMVAAPDAADRRIAQP